MEEQKGSQHRAVMEKSDSGLVGMEQQGLQHRGVMEKSDSGLVGMEQKVSHHRRSRRRSSNLENEGFSVTPLAVVDPRTNSDPVTVKAFFNSVTKVDALSHMMEAEIFVELSWVLHKAPDQVDIDSEWFPQLEFINCASEVKRSGRLKNLGALLDERGEPTKKTQMARSWCVRGNFTCYFELQHFPFDQHRLFVQAIAYQPYATLEEGAGGPVLKKGRIEWKIDHEGSRVLNSRFVLRDSWELNPEILIRAGATREEEAERGTLFPTLDMGISVRRYWEFYHWNVVLPTSLFVAVPYIVVLYDTHELHNRAEIILGMLLTSVAFKFVINAYVPQISYLTLLDKYHITGTCFLVLMFVEAAMLKVFHELDVAPSKVRWVDRGMIATMALAWAAINYDFMYCGGSFYRWMTPVGGDELGEKAQEEEQEERRFFERALSGRVDTAQRYRDNAAASENPLRLRANAKVVPEEAGPDSPSAGS